MTAHLVQQLASTKVKGELKERAQRKNVKLRQFLAFTLRITHKSGVFLLCHHI
jgi:hypothetical protein